MTSPTGIAAVWVVAKTAMLADALATCLFFASPDKLTGAYDFQYLIMREDRSVEKSPNFTGEIFIML
jgi:thiamine biosynthesis lipoprotein